MKDVPMTTTFLPTAYSAILFAWLGSRSRKTFSRSNPGMGRVLGLKVGSKGGGVCHTQFGVREGDTSGTWQNGSHSLIDSQQTAHFFTKLSHASVTSHFFKHSLTQRVNFSFPAKSSHTGH